MPYKCSLLLLWVFSNDLSYCFKDESTQAPEGKVNWSRSKAGKGRIGTAPCLDPKPVYAFPIEPWCLLEVLNTLLEVAHELLCISETLLPSSSESLLSVHPCA